MEDSLYWPLSHDSRNSCKSDYRFLKEEAEPALGSPWNPAVEEVMDAGHSEQSQEQHMESMLWLFAYKTKPDVAHYQVKFESIF